MVLFQHKFAKLHSKLDNHVHNHHDHHRHHQRFVELSSSLRVFQLQVSKFVAQLALDLKSGFEDLSLSWIEKCFELLPFMDKAFAKLVLDLDYPMSAWEVDSIERYLNYTLSFLDLFNSISYSLSHLQQTRLSLSHAFSLFENNNSSSLPSPTRHLKPIQLPSFSFATNFGKDLHIQNGNNNNSKARFLCSKEMVINEALKEMKKIGFCVCGIVLSGLCNNGKPYLELRKMAGGFDGSLVLMLDTKINEQLLNKVPILKEIKEINDLVADLVASDEVKNDVAKELKSKLQVFEKLCDVVKIKVDDMFGKVMSQRTELIDCIRLIKQPL